MASGAELLETLSGEVEKLRTSEGWLAWLDVAKRFHRYSANNQMLIALQCPEATLVMGYGAKDGSTGWLSLGRQVRKGEKAIYVLAPLVKTRKDDDGEKQRYVAGFKGVAVFDVSQTDGEPLPKDPGTIWREALAEVEPDEADEARWNTLHAAAESLDRTVVIEETGSDGSLGWVMASDTSVVHVVRGDFGQMAATLAHELSHALDPELSERPKAEKELLAESSAWLVCQELGLAGQTPSTVAYLAGWKGDAEKLGQIADQSVKVSRQIIDALALANETEEVAA